MSSSSSSQCSVSALPSISAAMGQGQACANLRLTCGGSWARSARSSLEKLAPAWPWPKSPAPYGAARSPMASNEEIRCNSQHEEEDEHGEFEKILACLTV